MASDSLKAMLAVEQGLYLVSHANKTPDAAASVALEGLTLRQMALLVINLRPQHTIQVFAVDPESDPEGRLWLEEQARASLLEELTPA